MWEKGIRGKTIVSRFRSAKRKREEGRGREEKVYQVSARKKGRSDGQDPGVSEELIRGRGWREEVWTVEKPTRSLPGVKSWTGNERERRRAGLNKNCR